MSDPIKAALIAAAAAILAALIVAIITVFFADPFGLVQNGEHDKGCVATTNCDNSK